MSGRRFRSRGGFNVQKAELSRKSDASLYFRDAKVSNGGVNRPFREKGSDIALNGLNNQLIGKPGSSCVQEMTTQRRLVIILYLLEYQADTPL